MISEVKTSAGGSGHESLCENTGCSEVRASTGGLAYQR